MIKCLGSSLLNILIPLSVVEAGHKIRYCQEHLGDGGLGSNSIIEAGNTTSDLYWVWSKCLAGRYPGDANSHTLKPM